MKKNEAEKIFNVWKNWYWPVHSILFSIFGSRIPKSFLPYDIEILEEALNIIAREYHVNGEIDISRDIQGTIGSLVFYCEEEEAINHLKYYLDIPELEESIKHRIKNYRKVWTEYIKK